MFENENGNKENFFKFQFKPNFNIGKLRLGLDLTYYLDSDGDIHQDNWNGDTSWINKINFIEYGNKRSNRFWRIGFLEDVTLGNGTIVRNYSNKTRYPEKPKKTGFFIRAKNDFDDGFEFLVNDVDSAKLIATRGYIVPYDDVQIGISYAVERDPDSNDLTGDELTFYGIDFSTLVFKHFSKDIRLYEDYVKINNYGDSFTTGLEYDSGFRAKFLIEFTSFDSDYITAYFNNEYEIEKNRKYSDLLYFASRGRSSVRAIHIRGSYNLIDIARFEFWYQEYDSYEIQPELRMKVNILKGKIPGLTASIEYTNKDADLSDFSLNKDSKNVYITTKIDFDTKKGSILSLENKRIINEQGKPEHILSFSTGLKF
ncbi:MAG: hypothetical protein C0601_01205 [Candidatus Muiribacterium halophilum]|uniref:TonB-dependent receptor-like beta-barrel domain-containing protein n=1 Tax=Muiribacterium halophilum TaxID=2053465 RepID=A0A2N5ZLX0_MUIH1|nr:MAG: hypothetical protein C0601_01205 [Candidatus Muirbacterium halophilum]